MTILSNVKNRGSFVAALTVAAVIAAMAYAKVSKAWDQQAPDDQMSAELSHRILDSRHYSSGPYASANARARFPWRHQRPLCCRGLPCRHRLSAAGAVIIAALRDGGPEGRGGRVIQRLETTAFTTPRRIPDRGSR